MPSGIAGAAPRSPSQWNTAGPAAGIRWPPRATHGCSRLPAPPDGSNEALPSVYHTIYRLSMENRVIMGQVLLLEDLPEGHPRHSEDTQSPKTRLPPHS